MNNTTNNEPRDYIFFDFEGGATIISNARSFKDAINKYCKFEGKILKTSLNLFRKDLEGFRDNDVEGIMSLFYRYTLSRAYTIDRVYLIDKKIYALGEIK